VSDFAPEPERASPPGTVRISSYLLYATAALTLVSMIVSLTTIGTVRQVYQDLYAGEPMADTIDTVTVASIVGAGIASLLMGVGLVVLAFLNLRGKNVARIVTWVLGGFFVVCCGGLSLLGLAGSSMTDFGNTSTAGGPSPEELQQRLNDALPGWYNSVNVLLTVLTYLFVLVALILLALPASNEWFKPRAVAGWQPPVPGYPVVPGAGYPSPYQPGEPPLPPPPGSQPGEPPLPPPGSQPGGPPGGEPPRPPAPPN